MKPIYKFTHNTSSAGTNLWSISTAATCLAPACKTERVKDQGPEPTSQTKQSNTSASPAILSAVKDLEFLIGVDRLSLIWQGK
jgi:hypothetical protein